MCSAASPIERVVCVVLPPNHLVDTNTGVPVVDVAERELVYNPISERYESVFDGFSEAGIYKAIFYAEDIWGGISFPKQSYITQSGFEERVLLIAGGTTNHPAMSNITQTARFAYHTFRSRLLDHEQIYFVHPDRHQDLDGDGTNDVDATPGLATIGYAITNWAKHADRLTVYLLGRGISNRYEIHTGELLDAPTLDGWLDTVQSGGTDANVIMDFDGAGDFYTSMTPPNGRERIVIASTQPNRPRLMKNGGTVSYSQYFLSQLASGASIGRAANRARKLIRRVSGSTRQRASTT